MLGHRRQGDGRHRRRLAAPVTAVCHLSALLLTALTALPAAAIAQQAPVPAANGAAPVTNQDQGAAPEGDLLNPTNLFQLFSSVKTAPGTGPDGTLRTVTTETYKVRADGQIVLDPQWLLALRTDLPFIGKDPITSGNPKGDTIYGLSDADAQAALIHVFDDRWKAGFGVRIYAPTGGDTFGTGKWQFMPGAAVRYSLPEISSGAYFEPLIRYDVSFAGDPTRRSISNLQFAPMLNISLPDRWFFTLYPNADIRWNFGDPITGQTGRLFLPFDARIGRKFTDNFSASLEVGVPIIKQYPVYDFTTQLRLNLTF